MGVPQARWMVYFMETPIQMDEVPADTPMTQETSIELERRQLKKHNLPCNLRPKLSSNQLPLWTRSR